MKKAGSIIETMKAVFTMPFNISKISARIDDLLRIEKKLDLINRRLDDYNLKLISHQSELIAGSHDTACSKNHNLEAQAKDGVFNIISAIDKRIENQFLQIESLLSIYQSLPNIRHLPQTRGWAGSPDFLAKIIEVILKEKPKFVLEVSSGVSTVIIGLALKLNNRGKVVSLDHEKSYAEITSDNISFNHIAEVSSILHCPLRSYRILEESWLWYETKNLNLFEKIDLMIIDGPPGSSQFLARYPAVPLLHQYFSDRTLIILDDSNRDEEVIVVQKWVKFLEDNNFKVSVSEYKNFEKGMVILEVCRHATNN